MDVCSQLRKQQDEEVNLSMQLQTQKALLERAEGAYHKVNARLKELQASYTEGSGTKLLETLKDDVTNLRFQVRGVRSGRQGLKWLRGADGRALEPSC